MSLPAYQKALQTEIESHTYGEHPLELYEPIHYLMMIGGKRLRPCLTLMTANMWLFNWQKALKPALAVEVFHNFTLMHDDIMDNAPTRRGKSTVHEKWGVNTAILSGDVMLVAAYKLLESVEDKCFKKVLKRFNQVAAEVCEGQALDMQFASRNDVSKEEYIHMIRLKTSVLLGFALELGAIIAEADDESVQSLYEIGVSLGIGFQLKDDILDVYADPEKFGKKVGGDIIENKKTWLLLDALERSENTQYAEMLNFWITSTDFIDAEKVKAVTEIYDELNVKSDAEAESEKYFNLAFEKLRDLKVSDDKKSVLIAFAEDLFKREF
jgi:geranylgeranyl diphosphate synthase type II